MTLTKTPAADPQEARPDPDALAAAAAREGKGRLLVFLGAAPGVGKTCKMLNAARRRRDEGTDVLVGVIETHGRAETAAEVADLPVLPSRDIAYRNQVLHEFDADGAIARRPDLLLVDELAHTNVPGSRRSKRWEDVADILDAGIHVWTTLNVQHLESLNDDIARITGVRVSETLPDYVLERADEIELVDVTPTELQRRLQEGRIYRSDIATRALRNFFREGNLTALREIALRKAAQHVDADVRDYMRMKAIPGPWPASERVLALVGPDAASVAVVRHAKRLADALHAPWIALHVENNVSAMDARAPLLLAAQLGAEIETRPGPDVVATTLAVASSRNATQIVMGRARPAVWRRLLGMTLSASLLRHAAGFALHIVPSGTGLPQRPARATLPAEWQPWVIACLLVGGVIALGEALRGIVEHEALGMLFLGAAVAAATLHGLAVGLFAAALGFLSWNFFFIPPIYKLTIYEPRDVIAIIVFAGVAAATGMLASRLRTQARAAAGRIEGLRRIGTFSRTLGEPVNEPELLEEIARQAAAIGSGALVLTGEDEDLNIRAACPPADTMDEGSWAAARWCYVRKEEAGRGTSTLPSATWRFIPMRTARGLLGILGARPAPGGFDPPALQTLGTLADQAALALERVRLAFESARTAAQSETQKLRTALLRSLSHDLRTPLTGIRGAADTLRELWNELAPDARTDLLKTIDDDAARMARFLGNIMDLTRLESGEIAPRLARVAPAELIEAAIARVPDSVHIGIHVADPSVWMIADPVLLEQVLVNVLENALKYAPPHSLISVRVESAGATTTIAVADEGIGVPAEDLPHIFDSLYRARRGDRVAPGTGLGLAIARGLMDVMGGAITAQSPRPDAARDGAPGTLIALSLPGGTGA